MAKVIDFNAYKTACEQKQQEPERVMKGIIAFLTTIDRDLFDQLMHEQLYGPTNNKES